MSALLLLSGGLDSALVAALFRPGTAAFVDYGQRPAAGERRAARTIASSLGLPLEEVSVDLTPLGSGLLTGQRQLDVAPSPEWFPFRNQFLVTVAAAIAVRQRADEVWIGLTAGDGIRHRDGSAEFVSALNDLLVMQEGAVRLRAPAGHLACEDLVTDARLPRDLLDHTISCHISPVACGQCPGCNKRSNALRSSERA